MNKNAIAAILAAATMTVAFSAHAALPAQASAPGVAPFAQRAQAPAPKVTMGEAVANAEKAGNAESRSARLHMSPNYGQVWDVRMVRGDNTRVRSFVDAQSGRVLASDEIGIREPARHAKFMGKAGRNNSCAAMGMPHARGPHNAQHTAPRMAPMMPGVR